MLRHRTHCELVENGAVGRIPLGPEDFSGTIMQSTAWTVQIRPCRIEEM